MRSFVKNSNRQSSDSSVSLDEVTNVDQNVYSLLKNARAVTGPSSEIPKVDDLEQNKIKKNFRKSIIKRAVHPNFISSTPFHLKQTGTRNSFENISSISDIGTENNSCRIDKTLEIVEENDCEENDQPKQKNVSKELTVLPDHIENPCQKESVRNNSNNTSAKVEFLNEISLGNAKNQTVSTVPEQNQLNQSISKNRAEVSKHLDEILGLTLKENVDNSEIKEKTIVEESRLVHKNDSPEKRTTTFIEDKEDDQEHTLGKRQSKIIIEHSTTDYDEETSTTKQNLDEKKISEKHNDTRKSQASQIPSKDDESSDFEILSRSKRKVSPQKQKQDKQIVEEHSDTSPRKRMRIVKKTGRGISTSRQVPSMKSQYSRKKGYDSNEESSATENETIEETFRSTKRKKHSSDEADSELNEERPRRNRKVIRKLEKSQHFVNEQYSEPETDNRNEKPVKKRNEQVQKREKSRIFRRKEHRSEEESDEKHEIRGKKEVLKRGKSYGRKEYFNNEEDAEVSYVRMRKRSKSQHKPARIYHEEDQSSDEESMYEVVKVRGKSVLRKLASSKHHNRKMYSDYENDENEEYERRENRVLQERVRGRSSKRRIFEEAENEREYNEEGKIKTIKTLQKRPKSQMRIVYESAEDSPELIEHNKNARKTLTKPESSRLTQRKMYYIANSNNDSNEEQEAVRKKIIIKRQPSRSHKKKDYYSPKIPSDSYEVSEDQNTYEEVKKGRQSKKVLYVVEDDSTVDQRTHNLKKEEKNYRYVDLQEEKSRKIFKKPHSEIVRHPSKVKSKEQLMSVIVGDSDGEESFIRIPKSKIYSAHQEPKKSNIMRPSSSKRSVVLKDINESFSPESKQSVLLKKYGRLSRRESYVLEKQTTEDSSSDNFATPVNQKIMPNQAGIETLVRAVLKVQLEENKKAKEHPETDTTIRETIYNKKSNKKSIPNKGIVANPNNKEDEPIETNDNLDKAADENHVKNLRKEVVEEILNSWIRGEQYDENSGEGQRNDSIRSHSLSIASLQETIKTVNFAKQGDLPNFTSSLTLTPLQRLARNPCSNFDSNSISIANNTTRQSMKAKKNIKEVIRYLKEECSKKNKETTNVSIQTSLGEKRSGDLSHPSEKSAYQPTRKAIVVDPHNVASSSVKTSKIPVKCQKISSRTTSKEGTVQNAQKENTQKSTDQLVFEKKSKKVTPKKNRNLQRDTSATRMDELDEEAQDRSRENLEEDCEIPTVQDISVKKADKLEVTSKQRKERLISNNKEDEEAEVIPNEPEEITPNRRKSRRFNLNDQVDNPTENESKNLQPVEEAKNVSSERLEEVTPSRRITRRSLLNVQEDDPAENLPTASEPVVEKSKYVSPVRRKEVTPRKRMSGRFTSNVQEDDPTRIQSTASESVEESPESLERFTPRRRMSRRFTLDVQEADLTGIQPLESESYVPFEDERKVTPSSQKSRRSTLSTKEDNITESEPTVLETQGVEAKNVPYKHPKEATENNQRSGRSRSNNQEEEPRAPDTTDSESQSVSKNQDDVFVKPVGVPVRKNKKTRQNATSTAESTSDENEARTDQSGSKSKKKKNSKTVAEENVEEAPTVRRSARERKVVDTCMWRSIFEPTKRQKSSNTDTSADSSSMSSSKKRGRPRLTKKENNSASEQKQVEKSKSTDEENNQRNITIAEVHNSVEPDNESDTPSTSTTSTEKRKKKQRLTIKTKTKKESKKTVNDKKKKNGEEISNASQTEDITEINERLTDDGDINNTTNQTNNLLESNNKKQALNIKGAKSASQQKKTTKNSVIEERNHTGDEINIGTDDNVTEIHERLTDVYCTSEESSSQRQAESWENDGRLTATSCTEDWYLIDKIKRSMGHDTMEVYKIRDTTGYLAIPPGKKRYSVINLYDVDYQKLEGTIQLIMEDVLYTELPDFFTVGKGVRAQILNTGDRRALFFYSLR